jgi:hypothetical protein
LRSNIIEEQSYETILRSNIIEEQSYETMPPTYIIPDNIVDVVQKYNKYQYKLLVNATNVSNGEQGFSEDVIQKTLGLRKKSFDILLTKNYITDQSEYPSEIKIIDNTLVPYFGALESVSSATASSLSVPSASSSSEIPEEIKTKKKFIRQDEEYTKILYSGNYTRFNEFINKRRTNYGEKEVNDDFIRFLDAKPLMRQKYNELIGNNPGSELDKLLIEDISTPITETKNISGNILSAINNISNNSINTDTIKNETNRLYLSGKIQKEEFDKINEELEKKNYYVKKDNYIFRKINI